MPGTRTDAGASRGWGLPLVALVALALALTLEQIGWGLPSELSWAPDEITPTVVDRGRAQRFSGGWWHHYPPLHLYLLALLEWPVRWLGLADDPGERHHALFLAGRALSAVMAAGLVVATHRAAMLLHGDRRAALLSALLVVLTPTFVYFGKLANTDLPYTLWVVVALGFYLRALSERRMRDVVSFAFVAALAVTTKDQAVGLLVGPSLHLVWAVARERRAAGKAALGALVDRRLLVAAIVGLSTMALVYNVVFNAAGVARHFHTGDSTRDHYHLFAHTLGGQLESLSRAAIYLAFILTPPVLVAAVLGIARARRRFAPEHLAGLALVVLPYLAFLLWVGRHYVRFFLPVGVVLALFAGPVLAELLGRPGARRAPRVALVAVVLALAAWNAVTPNRLMAVDPRLRVEAWLAEHVEADDAVAALGHYLPRLARVRAGWQARIVGPADLERLRPDWVVVNATALTPHERVAFQALAASGSGYERVLSARAPLALEPPGYRRDPGPERPLVHTNLGRINPEIQVYRRR